MKKKLKSFLNDLALSFVVFVFRVMAFTYRFREVDSEGLSPYNGKKEEFIYAFQHSQLLPAIYFYRKIKMASLASLSKDGEYAAKAAEKFGMKMVRGSSSRGGAKAFMQLKKLAEEGYDIAITADGPRGPAGSVNSGVLYLAKFTGRKVVPFAFSAAPMIRLSSWDRFMIPLFFAKGIFKFGEPVEIPRDLDKETEGKYRSIIQKRLQALNDSAEKSFRSIKSDV
ncbi:MAG: lysophospholipid acyltransferase family protein [Candidatus Goldiibacteriota bacterium]